MSRYECRLCQLDGDRDEYAADDPQDVLNHVLDAHGIVYDNQRGEAV